MRKRDREKKHEGEKWEKKERNKVDRETNTKEG